MDFNLVNLVIHVRTSQPAQLACWLPAQGAAFADTCRSTVCRWPERVCSGCSARCDCAWYTVFGQDLAVDPEALRRHQKPSLPFAFSFPILAEIDHSSGRIQCGMVVVGNATACLNLLLEGFMALLLAGPGQQENAIQRIECLDYQGERNELGDRTLQKPENLVVLSSTGILESRTWDMTGLEIHLMTPLRMVAEGHPLVQFNFSLFARSLLRRVSAMAYYYGGCEPGTDFRELSRHAADITCIRDNFQYGTAGWPKGRAGITGSGSFSGHLEGLMPFLILGSYLNGGKNAAFGSGRFAIQ